jgi:hypothetical protein
MKTKLIEENDKKISIQDYLMDNIHHETKK